MSKAERLEDALLLFIERVVKKPSSEKEVEILPQVAHELVILLKH